MTIKNTKLGGTDWADGNVLYAADQNDTFDATLGFLGEVRMFALSMSNAITKASLQTAGWAICDGTTPAAQGISSPTITTTPNLEEKFIRMSGDESSSGTGGAVSHQHDHGGGSGNIGYDSGDGKTDVKSNLPPYYELVFFIKVVV